MFLMRAFLNPDSVAVRADIANPDGLHKTVMRAFANLQGPRARQENAILHRLDRDQGGRLVLLVQSSLRPEPSRWPTGYVAAVGSDVDFTFSQVDNPAIRDVSQERASISAGRRFLFRIKANTTKRLAAKSADATAQQVGKRVPVRGDDARRQWFARHAVAAGIGLIDISDVRITEVAPVGAGKNQVTVAGAVFEGVLIVGDAEKFRIALTHGIGPAKAYGFGLLSIAAIR
jgi:CRISPR system Cascade subunit CasE